jgi:hypothetical protein
MERRNLTDAADFILAGCQQQHDDKDMLSHWRDPPRPAEKSAEQEAV